MRIVTATLLCVVLGGLAASSAGAGMLDSRKNEWAFSLNYTNQSSTGTATNVDFSWGHLCGQGRLEAGLSGTYQRLEDKSFGNDTTEATVGGPFMAWNWTPHSDKATGFFQAGVGAVGGDLHNVFDYSLDAELGVKFFVGNSAAVIMQYFYQRLGSKSSDVNGQAEDFDGVAIGIALFTGRR
jgi:hypothetical protein